VTGSAAIALERARSILPADRASVAAESRHDNTRRELASAKRVQAAVHEAIRPSRSRKIAMDHGSANRIVGLDAKQLRAQARHLERDHDISRNALNTLVQNTVGSGIDVIPAPRKPGGKIDRALATDLRQLWDEWWDRPEVTWTHDYGKCQDLLARSWFRDGEVMFQTLSGPVRALQHGTRVPLSLELLEADLLPLDFNDPSRNILQGVERNAWGRPIAYHVYKHHPGDPDVYSTETKRVPAEQLYRLALVDRIHQVRGLSVFASVIARLEDIKDYEDSERIAAKVAASLSAQIIKGQPEMYTGGELNSQVALAEGDAAREYRALTMRPGLIADDLLPGERVELIDSKRPNPNTETFRTGQLRAAAGGFGVSYSSLSLDYNGTYSAQRQELVEKWGGYHKIGEAFIALQVRPTWKAFVNAAAQEGLVKLPSGWKLHYLQAASYIRPVMPWIDPLKEAIAKGEAEDRGWQSPQQNTLLMGNEPDDVLTQTADWHEQRRELLPASANSDPDARAQLRRSVVAATLKESA
jgi:lambda family phage portal protein